MFRLVFCGYGSRFSKWSSMRFASALAFFYTFFVFVWLFFVDVVVVSFTSSKRHFVCQNVSEREREKNNRFVCIVKARKTQKVLLKLSTTVQKWRREHGCEQKTPATLKKRDFLGEVTTVKNRIRISAGFFSIVYLIIPVRSVRKSPHTT